MDDPTNPTIAEILADLEVSKAEALAGETVPLDEVLSRLERELDEWLAEHSPEPRRGFGM